MVLPLDAGRPETTLAIACLAANVAPIYRIKLQERAASVRAEAVGRTNVQKATQTSLNPLLRPNSRGSLGRNVLGTAR